jgi:RimJ/RimL family protein N-acetyltransferase
MDSRDTPPLPDYSLRVVVYDERFLEMSWIWLRDQEIKQLTMTPDFTKEQQLVWYAGLWNRKDYLIWGIELNGEPIGAFGIKNIDSGNGEYWGYIGRKELWGKGIGGWMVNNAILQAVEIGLCRLYLKVAVENKRAIKLYTKSGFIIKNTTEEVIYMEYRIPYGPSNS